MLKPVNSRHSLGIGLTLCMYTCLVKFYLYVVYTDTDTWSDLKERSKIPPYSGTICDVYDGEMYRKLYTFLSQPANVSLLLNTDGVSLFHSSTVSLWPYG